MNYQEYKQSLNQRLTDKVQRELSAFQEEMLGKPPQEIYDAAYQITLKNDIAVFFGNRLFPTGGESSLKIAQSVTGGL